MSAESLGSEAYAKIGAIFAKTSSMIGSGTDSSNRPERASRSIGLGWSQRITPAVFNPNPVNETAKPRVRAKAPPVVIGTTIGVPVTSLNLSGETTSTGLVPCCSCPAVGSKETR